VDESGHLALVNAGDESQCYCAGTDGKSAKCRPEDLGVWRELKAFAHINCKAFVVTSQVNDSNDFTIQACGGMQRKGGEGERTHRDWCCEEGREVGNGREIPTSGGVSVIV